ncbi:ferredoxin family protein [Methyloligella sp. GL2]|uniref:ferredoxin family protein n=1 Tax=Methyloligella sp. GL2 TaxID=2742204 RepID=UPI001FEF093F|nr:ferredoxin family protein [Methyloligella sp. GL2]
MDCVEVCPVDCFYEGENMLVIHPDECISCGVCVYECPVSAILLASDPKAAGWDDFNLKYAEMWPNITQQGTPPANAKEMQGVPDKLRTSFSEKPGAGS